MTLHSVFRWIINGNAPKYDLEEKVLLFLMKEPQEMILH